MFKLLKCLKSKWYLFAITMGAIILQCYLQLMLPEYMGNITQLIVSTDPDKITQIWINGGWMIDYSKDSSSQEEQAQKSHCAKINKILFKT